MDRISALLPHTAALSPAMMLHDLYNLFLLHQPPGSFLLPGGFSVGYLFCFF